MGKKSKIRPSQILASSSLVVPTKVDDTQKVSFNFKRLHVKSCGKFNYQGRDANYFLKLIDRLKNLCDMTRKDLMLSHNKTLRCHSINFVETTENSFGNWSEDLDIEPWQFSLSRDEHGRVHGYFIDNVFYIVWLDPEHELYK